MSPVCWFTTRPPPPASPIPEWRSGGPVLKLVGETDQRGQENEIVGAGRLVAGAEPAIVAAVQAQDEQPLHGLLGEPVPLAGSAVPMNRARVPSKMQ